MRVVQLPWQHDNDNDHSSCQLSENKAQNKVRAPLLTMTMVTLPVSSLHTSPGTGEFAAVEHLPAQAAPLLWIISGFSNTDKPKQLTHDTRSRGTWNEQEVSRVAAHLWRQYAGRIQQAPRDTAKENAGTQEPQPDNPHVVFALLQHKGLERKHGGVHAINRGVKARTADERAKGKLLPTPDRATTAFERWLHAQTWDSCGTVYVLLSVLARGVPQIESICECVRCPVCSRLLCCFCGWGVVAQSLIRLGLGPPLPKGCDPQRSHPHSPPALCVAHQGSRALALSLCAKKRRLRSHSRRVSRVCVLIGGCARKAPTRTPTRVETVPEITAPPLVLHSTSHSHLNPKPCQKSQPPAHSALDPSCSHVLARNHRSPLILACEINSAISRRLSFRAASSASCGQHFPLKSHLPDPTRSKGAPTCQCTEPANTRKVYVPKVCEEEKQVEP